MDGDKAGDLLKAAAILVEYGAVREVRG